MCIRDRNTLVNFAIKGTDFESLSDVLEGPNAFAISTTDATAPARVIAKFAKMCIRDRSYPVAKDYLLSNNGSYFHTVSLLLFS